MMTAKTKLILKNCTRLVSFILILLLLLYGTSFLLEPKNNDDAAGEGHAGCVYCRQQ